MDITRCVNESPCNNVFCMGYCFYTSLGDYEYFLSTSLILKSKVDSFIIIFNHETSRKNIRKSIL